ncbi:hypothetical protein PMZ80_000554 [Knufia obscura]|uniref:Uncharacterized protein n=2 Tax=Knufia TaxID=430999 RepID=A0AAN8EIA3_9EURO|nr:hypothetical protein PMZ80_000554 [Knufia obscura]KAK5956519.1 hypothetical protein OHC33_002004 [Knufia fluminis]
MDQDDSMLSTPSSNGNDDTYDEESMFPSETATTSYIAPETPQNDHLNAAAPGELSPPRSSSNTLSQTQSQPNTNGFLSAPLAVDSNDISEDDEGIDMKGERSRGAGGTVGAEEKNKPGAGWKNKKAQEDMQRSWDFIVDRDFDVRQFGDPLAGKQK